MSRNFDHLRDPYNKKYLHTGAQPKKAVVKRSNKSNKSKAVDNPTERDFGGEVSPSDNLVPVAPEIQPNLLPVPQPKQVPVIQDLDLVQLASGSNLPEGPPLQSPLPPGWTYRGSYDNIRDPREFFDENLKIDRPFRNCQSEPSSPKKRTFSVIECPIVSSQKLRSPFLGFSPLASSSAKPSQESLDWDNFSHTPSFYRRPTPIPVVSTPSTSPENSPKSGQNSSAASHKNNNPNMTINISSELNNEALALLVTKKGVDNLITLFPPENMTADRLPFYNDELKDIKDKFLAFSTSLLTFLAKYSNVEQMPNSVSGEQMSCAWWEEQERQLSLRVTNHALKVRQAASELLATSNLGMTEFQKKELELKEKQIALMEKSQERTENSEKANANALANSKYDEILVSATELEGYLTEVTDWNAATRAQVITAMKSLDKWATLYSTLNQAYREFTVATTTYPIEEISDTVQQTMDEINELYTNVVKQIRDEDTKRELYSLAGSSAENVKLPKFSGNPGEDFPTFKSKLLLALEKNRVPLSDKVEKLRGCLSGQALSLVPEKTKDFSAALEVLADAFGNPEKVLAVKIAEFKKLGKCPPETLNGKLNYQAVVSFCLKVEVLLQDLIDLAESENNEELKYDVYGSSVRASVQGLFSLKDIMKMRCLKGRGKTGLEEHINYVKEYRVKAQNMIEPAELNKSGRKGDSKITDSGSSPKSSLNMFKSPRRFDECRICVTLETEGETGLYIDHISDSVIGCPKFQSMSAEERRTVSLKAKLCIKCCNKDVVFNIQHSRNCKVNRTQKLNSTCVKYPKCTTHSWICSQHKEANKSKIQDFSRKFKITPPVNTNLSICTEKNLSISSDSSCDVESTNSNSKSSVMDNVDVNAVKPEEVSKIIKNMRRNARKKGSEVFDIPDGNSLFILSRAQWTVVAVMLFLNMGFLGINYRASV